MEGPFAVRRFALFLAVLALHSLSDLSQCFFFANTGVIREVTEVIVIAVSIATDSIANIANFVLVFIPHNAMRL